MTEKKSVFEILSNVDTSGHVEKKMNLSYLSWAWAWNTLKSIYPNTPVPKATMYQEMLLSKDDGWQLTDRKVPYLTTPQGTSVEVTVTIEGVPYTQSLYVMDNRNKVVINPNMGQINKTTMRCTVKAIAMAGLGLNLYAGEDLPMGNVNKKDKKKAENDAVLEARLQTYEQVKKKIAKISGETTAGINKVITENIKKDEKYAKASDTEKLIMAINFGNQMLAQEDKNSEKAV